MVHAGQCACRCTVRFDWFHQDRAGRGLYAPGNGDLKLWATFTKGTLQYVSGIIAKLKPDAVQVKTPAGIIGVRGTRFLARVDEVNP